ncbi:hypothetical protein [Azospirillum oleiclasticum]|nr:hypothetical protein [Azospirillum oleiclasticum]
MTGGKSIGVGHPRLTNTARTASVVDLLFLLTLIGLPLLFFT